MFVSAEDYLDLLSQLAFQAKIITPPPDVVIGMKRSGLFPAVFISHQLELPMMVESETKSFPGGKFSRPLIVDTTAWNGSSIRRVIHRLEKLGVENSCVLVMIARKDPPPNIPGLVYLKQATRIPVFWYAEDWAPGG